MGSLDCWRWAWRANRQRLPGKFFDSDTDKMIRLIQAAFRDVSEEYLLSQDEAEKISDKLVAKINEKALKKMHSSKDRYWHA